jgi:TetR/AcrR family transcriptional regulator, cholesterol catabolism regulator
MLDIPSLAERMEARAGTYNRFVPRKSDAALAEDTSSKSARTRERILDAAAHVLSRKGYAGTRLSDVADQAELQAPAIYYYFSSRDDLIEEVMWSGIAHMRDHITQVLAALPPGADPLERIDAAVEGHLRYSLEISDYTTASIRNAGQVPESIAIRYAAEASQYGDTWRKLLQDADNAGLLRPDLDLMAARMMVLGALNWAAEWWNPRRGSLDTVVRTAQSIVRNGLGTQQAARDTEAAARKPKARRRPAPPAD